jgi:GNAT superfamily N-acetyltransferase
MLIIRDYADADRAGVEAIDTSFQTSSIYDVIVTRQRIELSLKLLATPRVKRYPIADAFAHWAQWETGFVADDGGIVGFAAVAFEAWHSRLVLWHLYVAPDRRREGIGSALLARVEEHGHGLRAKRVWLETSNVNVPGIEAYTRLGYSLCGADVTMYDDLPYAEESAIYLAKRL